MLDQIILYHDLNTIGILLNNLIPVEYTTV